jgi:flagellar assembly protein FliH
MSDFTAGLAVRSAVPAATLARAMAPRPAFAAADPAVRGAPRHFSPAGPGHHPTAGWDPLDPSLDQAAIDPVEVARAEGFAEGLAAARAEVAGAAARNEALVAGLAEALAGSGMDRAALAARLRQTVLHLVTRLVGETGVSADLLTARVEAATELLADKAESALLRLHPDDVALVEGRLPASVFAAGDPHVDRGSFVLESASTVVEDGPALWLDQLAGAIDKVPVPGC